MKSDLLIVDAHCLVHILDILLPIVSGISTLIRAGATTYVNFVDLASIDEGRKFSQSLTPVASETNQ